MRAPRSPLLVAALASLLLLVSVATQARAQERIDETRKLNADGTVIVSNVSGMVTVVGWDRKEVHVKGVLGEGTERLDIKGGDGQLEIKVIIPKRARDVEETILEIRMPEGGSVEVSAVSADIEVEGVQGNMCLKSVSGDVHATGAPAEVNVETVSGEVELSVESDRVSINSVSGDIHLERAAGDVSAETVSGDISIGGGTFKHVETNTVSGDLYFDGDLDEKGSSTFSCHSGDIELILPKKTDAEFNVTTFSGDIDNEFGGNGSRISKHAPGKELRFTVGSGGARVRIETFSGDVEIQKR